VTRPSLLWGEKVVKVQNTKLGGKGASFSFLYRMLLRLEFCTATWMNAVPSDRFPLIEYNVLGIKKGGGGKCVGVGVFASHPRQRGWASRWLQIGRLLAFQEE
jgi:hypothetical protein